MTVAILALYLNGLCQYHLLIIGRRLRVRCFLDLMYESFIPAVSESYEKILAFIHLQLTFENNQLLKALFLSNKSASFLHIK